MISRGNGPQNRINGQIWEDHIELRCRMEQLDFEKHPLGARRVGKGRLIAVRTFYDYTITDYGGKAAFFDAKRSESNNFCHSQVTWHQVQKLYERHRRGHIAGYLVFFAGLDQVVFFTADKLDSLAPGKSLKPSDGKMLGSMVSFSLKLIFN